MIYKISLNIVKIFCTILLLLLSFNIDVLAKDLTNSVVEVEIDEIKLKFAFINKFIEYIDKGWSNAYSDGKIIIDVFGDVTTEQFTILQGFNQNKIKNIPVVIRVNPNIKKTINSDVVFVTKGSNYDIKDIIRQSNDYVLTIGDVRYFIDEGGIIEFYNYRGKIRFDINDDKAKEKGIFFNAKLLELSKVNR